MNKRLAKKKLKQSGIKVNKISLKDGEVAVFTYDRKQNYRPTILQQIFNCLKSEFGKNVVLIPNDIETMPVIHREKLIEMLKREN